MHKHYFIFYIFLYIIYIKVYKLIYIHIYIHTFRPHNNPIYTALLFTNEEIRSFDTKEYAQKLMAEWLS